MKTFISSSLFLFFHSLMLMAEYRAYELEVYDKTTNKTVKIITSFSPSDYILTNGGPDRISILIRASWICYGNASKHKEVCPMRQQVRRSQKQPEEARSSQKKPEEGRRSQKQTKEAGRSLEDVTYERRSAQSHLVFRT